MEGTVLVLHNLRHRRELEEDLMHTERLALIGTVTAGLLHEIRNPLGGIKGAAQLLKTETSGMAGLAEYASVILREVERLDRLLGQLLRFSHPSTPSMVSLNIHKLLDEVLFLEREVMSSKGIILKKELDPSLPMIWGDPSGLTQVFLNLVKNAVEAMAKGGVLRIGTKMETDFHLLGRPGQRFIRVEVEDTGSGISPENLKKIFAPFFTTKSSGTGLGLSIAHRIISEHGGNIRVDCTRHSGATFKVTLRVERGREDG
jgi:two-component system nitrogen regulation sensor histidine kinase GlnL